MNESLTGLLSFLFTIFILSYAIGDSPLFRLAVNAFIGTAAGYVAAVVLRQVIFYKLLMPLALGGTMERIFMVIPLFLSVLLLMKAHPRLEWMGRPAVAFLVGVGTASVVAGAVLGTLLPQVAVSVNMFDLRTHPDVFSSIGGILAGVFVLLGTVSTLAYFQFNVRGKSVTGGTRGKLSAVFALIGQVFISITLGAIFAGVLAAALTALVDRANVIVLFLEKLPQYFIQ